MTAIAFNLILGIIPTLVLGASIAAGIDDDRAHRRMFVFVYALWAISLAMWNWMRGYHPAWIIVWAIAGVAALTILRVRR